MIVCVYCAVSGWNICITYTLSEIRQNSWQQTNHAELYSDLLHAHQTEENHYILTHSRLTRPRKTTVFWPVSAQTLNSESVGVVGSRRETIASILAHMPNFLSILLALFPTVSTSVSKKTARQKVGRVKSYGTSLKLWQKSFSLWPFLFNSLSMMRQRHISRRLCCPVLLAPVR